jgi:hypothetical protein
VNILGFYFDVVRALDDIGASYMLVGAFAGSAFGIRRATFDVDILVDLHEPHFDLLAARFPPPRYYADPVQMRDSTRLGIMFNIIRDMLLFALSGLSGEPLDLDYIAVRAARLGAEVVVLWHELVAHARREVGERS